MAKELKRKMHLVCSVCSEERSNTSAPGSILNWPVVKFLWFGGTSIAKYVHSV